MRDKELYDGTVPAKIFETMAMGVPVVAAHGKECASFVEKSNSGIVVSPGEVEGLIASIQKVLGDPELHRTFSKSARQFAMSELDAEDVGRRYEQILKSCVDGK